MMIRHKEMSDLPVEYAEKLKKFSVSSRDFNIHQYRNVLVINNNKNIFYGEVDEYILKTPEHSVRPICFADAVIDDGHVIKNRYGEQEYGKHYK